MISSSFKVCVSDWNVIDNATDFSSLADELAKSGVQLYAESNGEVVFSNFKDDSEDVSFDELTNELNMLMKQMCEEFQDNPLFGIK